MQLLDVSLDDLPAEGLRRFRGKHRLGAGIMEELLIAEDGGGAIADGSGRTKRSGAGTPLYSEYPENQGSS